MRKVCVGIFVLVCFRGYCQEKEQDSEVVFRKRVLENTELDILSSYYFQDGDNASVTGGRGSEELTNTVGKINLSIPVNDNQVLTINAGVSAYTSASSSQLNPFDGENPADAFVASTGASKSDELLSLTTAFARHSKDRNTIWSLNASISKEHDYSSLGFGGKYSKLFNDKNSEISISGQVFLDNWSVLYPYELGGPGGDPETGEFPLFDPNLYTITGHEDYKPIFTPFLSTERNTYSVGLGFMQLLSKRVKSVFSLDVTQQNGLLSNHMQRVYFADFNNSFIDNFHLADDVEQLPSQRFKTALSGKVNYYINEWISLRTSYRYYTDNWGIQSHTFQAELPLKLTPSVTVYPSWRYYTQQEADYFKPYNMHLSTSRYYTSDYDLSEFSSHQYGFGASYTDVFTKFHIGKFRFKSIHIQYNTYKRNTGLQADVFTGGIKFIIESKKTK